MKLLDRFLNYISETPDYIEINTFRYYGYVKILLPIAISVHFLWFFLFYLLNFNVLALYNIFSFLFLSLLLIIHLRGALLLVLILTNLEFLFHGYLTLNYLNWNTGFIYHIFLLMHLINFYPWKKNISRAILSIVIIICFLLFYQYFEDSTYIYLDKRIIKYIYIHNIILVFIGQIVSPLFYYLIAIDVEKKVIYERDLAQKSLFEINNLNQELELTKERATKAYLDLEASQKQLAQSDKMITLGTMVAGVAHEINTPLGAIKANSENILESLRTLIQKINPTHSHISSEELEKAIFVLELTKESSTAISSREARAIRKKVISTLEEKGKINIEIIADYIVDMGLADALDKGDDIFDHPDLEKYLSIAGDLYGIRKKSIVIQTSAVRVSKIVKSLKSFMHFDQNETKIVSDLTEGMETVLIILHNKIKYGIEVIKNYGENIPQIPCYPDELNQVWTNLIHNAIQAMSEKGTLQIDIESLSTLKGTPDIDKRNPEYKGSYVAVSIQDSGSGISPEIRTKIFQAFFTTKPAGEGSGLGLHIIGKILEKHAGALYLESEPGKTRFTVILPVGL